MKRAKSENDGDDVNNLKQPYLSGAYIRSFVKQLASSRTMRDKKTTLEREGADPPPPLPRSQQQQQHETSPHKKQVRRRLQTRKPYQEKLLNMAEARREIVTALKLHRAAMKQQQQQQQQQQQRQIQQRPDFQSEQKSRRNLRIYASSTDCDFALQNMSPNTDSDFALQNSPYDSSWPAPPPPLPTAEAGFFENLDFALPRQALGLNLNLHDFITAPCSIYSASSPSTSSSPPPPPAAAAAAEMPRGFEFLNCVEIGGEEEREEEIVNSPFEEVMEFPAWLNANESCLELQQHVDHQDFFQGSVLPCMEIEEIEGMDGDWLA